MKKQLRFSLLIALCFVLVASLVGLVACNKDDTPAKPEKGTIQGVVSDKDGEPLYGATVYYVEEGVEYEDDDNYVEADDDGNFSITDVKVGKVTLTVSLTGYAEKTVELAEKDFTTEGVATTRVILEVAMGKVKGKVYLEGHEDVLLKGVSVSVNGGTPVTTGEDGTYELSGVPMVSTTTNRVTAKLNGYQDATKNVGTRWNNGVATVDIAMTQRDLEVLPGLKPFSLTRSPIDATKTTIVADELTNYFDFSANNLSGSSKVEYHDNEHFWCFNADTTSIANEKMVAFMSTKIKVDANHQWVTAYANTFGGQNGDGDTYKAELGLYVIVSNDPTNASYVDLGFKKVTATNPSLQAIAFDLSDYIEYGEVTIVLGTKYGYHCNISSIKFTAEEPAYVNSKDYDISFEVGDKTDTTEFGKDELHAEWNVGGAAQKNDSGIWLNCTDPWQAHNYDEEEYGSLINSYMYVATHIDSTNNILEFSATIDVIADCIDTKEGNEGIYFPYLQVLVIGNDGTTLYASGWESYWVNQNTVVKDEQYKQHIDKGPAGGLDVYVNDNNKVWNATFDLSEYVDDEDVTVLIACNVGYKATITNVHFTGSQAD